MVQRIFLISRNGCVGAYRRLWLWPHVMMLLIFGVLVYRHEGVLYDSLVSAMSLCLTITVTLLLFMALNDGREEISRKTIIRLRTLPINWLEECLGSSFSLLFYGISLMAPVILVAMLLSLNSGADVQSWTKLDYAVSELDGEVIVSAPKQLSDQERLVIKAYLLEDKMISDISTAEVPIKTHGEPESYFIKSMRLNPMPLGVQEVVLSQKVNERKRALKVFVKDVWLSQGGHSPSFSILNGALTLMVQGLFLCLLFTLLGRKVSIEVGVFFILGCLLIKTVYGLLGDNLLADSLDHIQHFKDGSGRFTSHWWEPILFHWTVLLSNFEWIKDFFVVHSVQYKWSESRWIPFPLFNPTLLKEVFSVSLLMGVLTYFLRPRQT